MFLFGTVAEMKYIPCVLKQFVCFGSVCSCNLARPINGAATAIDGELSWATPDRPAKEEGFEGVGQGKTSPRIFHGDGSAWRNLVRVRGADASGAERAGRDGRDEKEGDVCQQAPGKQGPFVFPVLDMPVPDEHGCLCRVTFMCTP